MVASLAMEPVSPGFATQHDYKHRAAMGERSLLAGSAKKPSSAATTDEREKFPADRHETRAEQPAEPERSRTADFAAAVIAGALPPTPQRMEELIRRIGASEIPEESQARLKDLLV